MKGICETCGKEADIDVHHKDKNHKNNEPTNRIRLCRWCHRVADGRQSWLPLPLDEVRRQYTNYFPRI